MSRRLALLVATYRYRDASLRQLTAPGHDAEALAQVLRHPEIADFDVTILVNEPHHVVGRAIGEFYRNRRRDDLTFLYFTGHGLKDEDGRLYLAMTDTVRDDLLFTALSAQQIDDAMELCRSQRKVLVLDCCYSGAFPAGRISKADAEVHALEKFRGKGRVVLTASDSTQYSFEGNQIIGKGTRSVFTRFLVEGLTTGKADLDDDGEISIDELYSYVYDRVVEEMPQQRPKKQENVEGRIVIARNIHWRRLVTLDSGEIRPEHEKQTRLEPDEQTRRETEKERARWTVEKQARKAEGQPRLEKMTPRPPEQKLYTPTTTAARSVPVVFPWLPRPPKGSRIN